MKIPQAIFDDMVKHAKEEIPNECCGFLAGKGQDVEIIYRMTNVDAQIDSYSVDPTELFRVEKDKRAKGMDHLVVYHSHPGGDAFPSERDVEIAYYPDCMYIIVALKDQKEPEVVGFWIKDGEVTPAEYEIV